MVISQKDFFFWNGDNRGSKSNVELFTTFVKEQRVDGSCIVLKFNKVG